LLSSWWAYFCGNVLAPAVSLAGPLLGSACAFESGQLGGAWAHDCAVGDEEVAEDQDESGGHGGWVSVADVASGLNGMSSEVECVLTACSWRGLGFGGGGAAVRSHVERNCGRSAVDDYSHVTVYLLVGRRCRIGGRATLISAIAATEHHPAG
jgi:hypothetical protein